MSLFKLQSQQVKDRVFLKYKFTNIKYFLCRSYPIRRGVSLLAQSLKYLHTGYNGLKCSASFAVVEHVDFISQEELNLLNEGSVVFPSPCHRIPFFLENRDLSSNKTKMQMAIRMYTFFMKEETKKIILTDFYPLNSKKKKKKKRPTGVVIMISASRTSKSSFTSLSPVSSRHFNP